MKTYYFYMLGGYIGKFTVKLASIKQNYPKATVYDKGRSIELFGTPNLSLGLTL